MKIPETVKVGAQEYSVVVNDQPSRENAFGQFDAVGLQIRLGRMNAPTRNEQTFVHEVMEALNHEYNIGLRHHQIELLELALYLLVRDNPGMLG